VNVAIVATGPLRARGQGRLLELRIAALRAAGHAVRLFTPPDGDVRVVDGLPVTRLSARDAMLEKLPGRERAWLAQDAYWVLYDGHDPLLETLRLVADRPIVAEYCGVPAAGRGAPPAERDRRARAIAGVRTLALAHRVLVPREDLIPELTDAGLDPTRIFVTCTSHEISNGGRRLDVSQVAPTLVAVGRPAPHRRLETLVECLARVARVHPDARLVVVGTTADPEARAARDDALGWARALGVLDRVRFTGEVDDAELAAHLDSGVAVFAGHGRRGLALAEARARGGPVVADGDGADAAALAAGVLEILARRAWPARTLHAASDIAGHLSAAAAPHSARPSLAPLLDLIAGAPIAYSESSRWPVVGALVSWVRGKATRHLAKYFVRAFEANQRRYALEAIRELRNVRIDAARLRER
jgi:glycosyltransferase involved in cell wall biosynthesis